jgi:hypothetical protein
MEQFDFSAPADVYSAAGLKRPQKVTYRKFPTGAEAVRFAMEVLPSDALKRAIVESDAARLEAAEIEALYWSASYPLMRKIAA